MVGDGPRVLEPFTLTEPQLDVAAEDHDAPQLVEAGPGAGKTHTVAARLAYLAAVEGLAPASEMVLLSYTRAAVREMKDRLREAASSTGRGELRRVNIRTMDSFAYRVHRFAGREYPGGDFDECIASATGLLRGDSDAGDYVDRLGHVIVDEAQDLVGVRTELIQEILRIVDGGFTVLSDPNQAIYDYLQYEEGAPPDTSYRDFRCWLLDRFDPATRGLPSNHRQEGPTRRLLDDADRVIAEDPDDSRRVHRRLVQLVSNAGMVTSDPGPMKLGDLPDLLEGLSGSTALLARKNGEVMAIADYLDYKGVPVRVRGPGRRFRVPGWVGYILPELGQRFTRSRVEETWAGKIGAGLDGVADGSEAFEVLRRAARSKNADRVETDRVVEAIKEPFRWPDEYTYGAQDGGAIVASTVHRAKGREFDNVLMLEPEEDLHDEGGEGDQHGMEARVIYVGLSRPKDVFQPVSNTHARFVQRYSNGSGSEDRWFRKPSRSNQPAKVEIKPDDLKPVSVVRDGAAERQEEMWEAVSLGSEEGIALPSGGNVWDLKLSRSRDEPELKIGKLRPSSTDVYKYIAKQCWDGFPSNVDGIPLEGLATVGLQRRPGDLEPYDLEFLRRGYWMVPVARGFGAMWRPRR